MIFLSSMSAAVATLQCVKRIYNTYSYLFNHQTHNFTMCLKGNTFCKMIKNHKAYSKSTCVGCLRPRWWSGTQRLSQGTGRRPGSEWCPASPSPAAPGGRGCPPSPAGSSWWTGQAGPLGRGLPPPGRGQSLGAWRQLPAARPPWCVI